FIQSKCGIVPGKMFDFSKEHIIKSVEGSLKRLKMDYLDALLLHRPDTLVEPEEVAAAFDELEKAGKVKYFGVSNQNPGQIELLKKYVSQPLLANQL
ncbi:aldo/keto reductase, partial [Enterococcus faecium]